MNDNNIKFIELLCKYFIYNKPQYEKHYYIERTGEIYKGRITVTGDGINDGKGNRLIYR